MKPVFADTFFFFAVLNRADPLHQRAVARFREQLLPEIIVLK
jgi:predicted nucleic acid-binding protein